MLEPTNLMWTNRLEFQVSARVLFLVISLFTFSRSWKVWVRLLLLTFFMNTSSKEAGLNQAFWLRGSDLTLCAKDQSLASCDAVDVHS